MQLIQQVQDFINTNQLLKPKDKIIIGVSGGADSMALLDILHRLNYNCIIAHCNFHLRGEESNRDELFVQQISKKYNIENETISFDTYGYMKEKSLSLEMAARQLRYGWFEKIRIKHEAQFVAVAHQQDDVVETILINMTRGTGLRGLIGMRAKNEKIIRPLLELSRAEIIDYLEKRNIPFVDDSTNFEDIYIRNKIRLNIIPQLETINPSVKQTVKKMSDYLSQVEVIYNSYIKQSKKLIFNNNQIDISLLQTLEEPKSVLFEILHNYGFNSQTIDDVIKSLNGTSGKIFLSNTHRLIKDRDKLLLEKNTQEIFYPEYIIYESDSLVEKPIKMSVELIKKDKDFQLEINKNILWLDKNKISYPLHIRKWQLGDKFAPFGMKGLKKLSDYFSDNKFSLIDKKNTWILSSNNNIVWIIGNRPDNRFRIEENTTDIIKITIIEN